jgi:2Fe-2S ferredoxin
LQTPDRDAVLIEPSGHDIPVQAGESPQAAALRLGYRWPTLCHRQGECTICFVKLLAGSDNVTPAVQQERDRLRERGRGCPEVRLACQLEIRGHITVLKRGLLKDT